MLDEKQVEQFENRNTALADIPSGLLQARQAAGDVEKPIGGLARSAPVSPLAGGAIGGLTFVNGVNGVAIGARKLRDGLQAHDTGKVVEGGAQGVQGVANVAQGAAGVAEGSLGLAGLERAAGIAKTVGKVGGVVGGLTDVVSGGYKVLNETTIDKKAGGAIDAVKGGLGVAGTLVGGTVGPVLAAGGVGLQAGKFIGEKGTDLANEISKERGYFGKDPFSKKGENLTAEGAASLQSLETKDAAAERLAGLRIAGYGLNDGAVDTLSTGAQIAHGTALSLKNTAYTLGRRGVERVGELGRAGFNKLRSLF